MKSLTWIGSSLADIKRFPVRVRREVGHQLHLVQNGLDPDDWKPMKTVGQGAREIRIRIDGAYRVIYVAKFGEAVYVLHAFEKKSQRTSKHDIDVAKARYQEIKRNRP